MNRPTIHVRSTKYDGSPHWEFDSWLVREEGACLITSNYAGQELQTSDGPWVTPYDTENHFWRDRWYNVMQLHEPDGTLAGWYCNVTTPAKISGTNVTYVDLDLDVRVSPDGRFEVLDEDEFLEHSTRMHYPLNVIAQARLAIDEIRLLVRGREVPFGRLPANVAQA